MAVNPLITCDSLNSWYDFSYSLSWSNNCEVADVLSDIPFISVGILVFGVSVLFLVLKRMSLSTVWLFLSALLAFVAAVVDLGKTLAYEVAQSTTFAASESAIRAREILFALSVGFRLLFYWSYASEPARKHLPATSNPRVRSIDLRMFESAQEPHSGSWMRWGLPGRLLGVGLLVAIITITVLQIAWRVVPRFHQYSSVYATDAALELLVSFLLLMKLLLNTITGNSPDSMLMHTFKECLAPISGLLVNIAIGVGGLLSFAFTESTVGRLLQAFEVYVIVTFAVVISLLKHCDTLLAPASLQGTERNVLFTLPEPVRGSTFRITPPCVETPRMSTILGATAQNMESSREGFRRSLNRISSWVSSRISRNRPRRGDEEAKLWNANNIKANPPYTESINTELRASIVSSTQDSKGWGEHVREAPTNHFLIIPAVDTQSAAAGSMEDSKYSGQTIHPSRAGAPSRSMALPQVQIGPTPASSVPPLVTSGTQGTRSIAAALHTSPVDGLSGTQSLRSTSDSRTSLDELLRQQSQLDQSIEALKLFSTRTSIDSNAVLSPKSAELTRSSSIGQKTVSSDVSLSNFPIPPWSATPVPSLPSSPGLSTMKRIRGDRHVRLAAARITPARDTYTSLPSKTSASPIDIPRSPRLNSIPHTPLGKDSESPFSAATESPRPDSGGTQYNVTSFIGGLATPGEPRQGNQGKPWWPRVSESSVGSIETGPSTKKVPPRMLPVPPGQLEGLSGPPAISKLASLALSSTTPHRDVDEPAHAFKYRVDEQTTRFPTLAISPPTPVTNSVGAENGVSIPSARPRFMQESIIVSTERADRVQRTFVRPRPPPLAIESYAGQNSSKLRVQVLADD